MKSRIKCEIEQELVAPPDPECVQRSSQKLGSAFTKAEESGECSTTDDVIAVESADEMVVQEVVEALAPPSGEAAPEKERECAASKAKAAAGQNTKGTKCERKNISESDELALDDCRTASEEKLETKFTKAESGGGCATVGDAGIVSETILAHVMEIAQALVPPVSTTTIGVSTTTIGIPTTTTTTTTVLGFVDNGDGTITDTQTGLTWEKKDMSGGIHDVANVYSWSHILTPSLDTGTAYTVFLPALNTGPCFAGHCDWRLPTLAELATLHPVDAAFDDGCAPACTVTTCSCTYLFSPYWSGDTYLDNQNYAYQFDFDLGFSNVTEKVNARAVRAVRP